VGIHIIIGIQRPDSTIINGQIKNNISFRVCGRFVDREPSQIMLNNDLASKLPNIKGRFIVKDDELKEVQCFYYSYSSSINLRAVTIKDTKSEATQIQIEEMPEPDSKPKPTTKSEPLTSDLDFDFSDIKK